MRAVNFKLQEAVTNVKRQNRKKRKTDSEENERFQKSRKWKLRENKNIGTIVIKIIPKHYKTWVIQISCEPVEFCQMLFFSRKRFSTNSEKWFSEMGQFDRAPQN